MGDVIERDGKGGKRFYVRFVDADGKRRMRAVKSAKNRKQALAALHDEETHAREGKKVVEKHIGEEERRKRTVTLRELAVRFCEETRPIPRKNYKPTLRVINTYRRTCKSLLNRHVLDRIGDVPAASVEPYDVEKLREQALEKFKDDTVAKAMGVLSRLYAWASRERLISPMNPCAGVTRPKEATGCPDYLDDEQCGRLIAWLEAHGDPMVHAMVVLSIHCGARKGEMFGLKWHDVHTDLKRLDIEHSYDGPTKNGVIESVKLHEATIPVLNRWRNVCPATPEALVFPVAAGKGRFRMGTASDLLDLHRAMYKALGRMWDRPWHLLRHSFASALVRRGVPLYTVGKLLRDRDPKVVMRYAKLSPEHLATEVDRLSFPAPTTATVVRLDEVRQRRDQDRIEDIAVTDSLQPSAITGE